MAVIFRDGFDVYNGIGAGTGMQSKWNSVITNGGFPATMVAGRFGGQGFSTTITGSAATLMRGFLPSAVSAFTLGFAFKMQPSTSSVTTGFHVYLTSTGTPMIGIRFNVLDNSVEVYRITGVSAGVLLGKSAPMAWQNNVFHYLLLECVISDAVGEVRVKLDGALLAGLNLTGQDTRNGTPTTINEVGIGCSAGGAANGYTCVFDDLFVADAATGYGERRVETLYAVSDGGTLNLVPSTGVNHFAVVDELTVNTSDWLSGSLVGDLDLLGLGNLSSTPAIIEEINVMMFSQKTDATTRAIAAGIKSAATVDDGANFNQAIGFAKYERAVALDPNTGLAWTPAAINALELQPKVTV